MVQAVIATQPATTQAVLRISRSAHADSMIRSIYSNRSRRASSAFKSIMLTFCSVRFVDATRLPTY